MRIAGIILVFVLVAVLLPASAADRDRDAGTVVNSDASVMDVIDFATNNLDINKIGQFVCNQGRFYPGSGEVGVTAEWPIGSGHEQMYRMNVFVGIPGNVVQSRNSRVREWNPLPGYHNGDRGFLAVSNDEATWPLDGSNQPFWPVRDAEGNAYILSQQDSYGVFDDGNNSLGDQDPSKYLNIEIHQSSYAWNTELDADYIIFQFDVVNNGEPKDSMYFTHYTDFDCGGWRGLVEYADDFVEFEPDRRFYYQYDADNDTDNWEGNPFFIGTVMLETPEINGEELGITDWHWTDSADEPDGATEDTEFFWYMSSDPRLRDDADTWPNLFHGDDIHFDDPSTIPDGGTVIAVWMSSGPYAVDTGDTLRFICAMVAGADYDAISANVDRIWDVYASGYQVKTVPQPVVAADALGGRVLLQWDNRIDTGYIDPFTGTNTLQGYRIYKTEDPQRVEWTLNDSVAVGEYTDTGDPAVYTWTDMDVINGFYYSYAVTAYDSLGAESGIAALDDGTTTVEVRPSAHPNTGDIGQVNVVPNPFVISAQWERERLGNLPEGEPVRELAFVNLPARCTIKIFTLDGDLVKTIQHDDGAGTEYWDIRSDFNQMVATGVYFFHVDADGSDHVGKFAIVR